MLKIRQIIFPSNTNNELPLSAEQGFEEWSNNLIAGQACYNLAIHSLPGNRFLINDNKDKNGPIVVGASGVFSMDFGVYPIFSLRIHKDNQYTTYPTMIDIVYQTAGEEE